MKTKIFENTQAFLAENKDYLNRMNYHCDHTHLGSVVCPRTREKDFDHALSMEVFDPLWMLTRQWQYGRFKGNDCGTPVLVKIKTSRETLVSGCDGAEGLGYVPLEYAVEAENRPITIYVRVESAMFFKKCLASFCTPSDVRQLTRQLIQDYPLDSPFADKPQETKDIEDLKTDTNSHLNAFYRMYSRRSFDGYKVYQAIKNNSFVLQGSIDTDSLDEVVDDYRRWFEGKFLPVEGQSGWNHQRMSYNVAMGNTNAIFTADDYDSGTLSWNTFDIHAQHAKASSGATSKLLSYIPTPAAIPGAPARRLWKLENSNVFMGNSSQNDFATLANSFMMQYISMYSNDWMIVPFEVESGVLAKVEGIAVRDSFGEVLFIDKDAADVDNHAASDLYTDRWCMFGNSRRDAYRKNDFSTGKGLLVPPAIHRIEESQPLEEVQFLRDEMSNMLWGVETVVSDQCGGTLDGKSLSDAVLAVVDKQQAQRDSSPSPDPELSSPEYSYLLQNRVPLNWIPFLPQQSSVRSFVFRRGRMPIYFNQAYNPVRPSTQLLGIQHTTDNKVAPYYINEEEIPGFGFKLVKTAQRARWYDGASFNWVGNKKVMSGTQANSGLLFDELVDKKTGKVIELQRTPASTPDNNTPTTENE